MENLDIELKKCESCSKKFNEGYYNEINGEHFCSTSCIHNYYDDFIEEDIDGENIFWTVW